MQELIVYKPPREPFALVVGSGGMTAIAALAAPWALSLFVWGALAGATGLTLLTLAFVLSRRLPRAAALAELGGFTALAAAFGAAALLFF